MFLPAKSLLGTGCLTTLLAIAGSTAVAQSDKIPREVIDQVAAHGSALVLVGLKVPWQMESSLSEAAVDAQREVIGAVQSDLLSELAGRKHQVIRRYIQIPGIALEVGADALAELARSPNVTSVLLDRPAVSSESVSSEKVPSHLFKRAADNGTVLVLAGLRTPWQREDTLSEELLALQRRRF